MIIGNGMMAKAMSSIDRNDTIFFCSGVSNSLCEDDEEYLKEFYLLNYHGNTEKKLIYFSSYAVNFTENKNIPYYKFKIGIEDFIIRFFKNYTIYRLPQVVSSSDNKHTLINFIYNKIINSESVPIYMDCQRNLIDIDDVIKVIGYANENNLFKNSVRNLIAPINYTSEDIVDIFEIVLGRKAFRQYIKNKGDKQFVLLSDEVRNIYSELNINFEENYLVQMIEKYYKKNE